MFYRASEAAEGAGLGLYIAKETIQKVGGNIKVSSTLGKGTTFTITLPVTECAPNETTTKVPPALTAQPQNTD